MADLLRDIVRWWHERDAPLDWDAVERAWPPGDDRGFAAHVARVGLINCFQWHLEDECRAQYEVPLALARLKHAIDASNRRRVSAIDEIDRRVAGRLAGGGRGSARPAVVTPGALIDQLSILELKRYHADARRRTDPAAADAVGPLTEQIDDYCAAIDELVRELVAGERRLKFYRTVKLYGAT
jgi:hypothetical protein